MKVWILIMVATNNTWTGLKTKVNIDVYKSELNCLRDKQRIEKDNASKYDKLTVGCVLTEIKE